MNTALRLVREWVRPPAINASCEVGFMLLLHVYTLTVPLLACCFSQHEHAAYPLSTLIMAIVDRYPPLTIVIHALPSPLDPSLSACLLLSSLCCSGSTSCGRMDAGICIRTVL